MAESADAPDSGSGGSNTVCVQVTLSAPRSTGVSGFPRGRLFFAYGRLCRFMKTASENKFCMRCKCNYVMGILASGDPPVHISFRQGIKGFKRKTAAVLLTNCP